MSAANGIAATPPVLWRATTGLALAKSLSLEQAGSLFGEHLPSAGAKTIDTTAEIGRAAIEASR